MSKATKFNLEAIPDAVKAMAEKHNVQVVGVHTTVHNKKKDHVYILETQSGLKFKSTERQLSKLTSTEALAVFALNNYLGSRESAPQYKKLQQMAKSAGAKLIDSDWFGAKHYYTFALADGRHVQIYGSKLIERGWPDDIDAYLGWSSARKLPAAGKRMSQAELFDEFKAMVAQHGATVQESCWLGARTPHAVLLSDGTVRHIKPNQLKYIGWPMVPYDELRKLAAPASVSLLPGAAAGDKQQFLLSLPGGWYKQGGFYELKALIEDKMVDFALEATVWAKNAKVSVVPQEWVGPEAEYEFMRLNGEHFFSKLPCAHRIAEQREANLHLGYIRRAGNRYGYTLVSEKWKGRDAAYAWTTPDGSEVFSTVAGLEMAEAHAAELSTLRHKGEQHHYTLESTLWVGPDAEYVWRGPSGEVVTMSWPDLQAYVRERQRIEKVSAKCPDKGTTAEAMAWLAELKAWAESVGLALQNSKWRGATASYMWGLPNGRLMVAPVHRLKAEVNRLLKGRTARLLTAADSIALLKTFPQC